MEISFKRSIHVDYKVTVSPTPPDDDTAYELQQEIGDEILNVTDPFSEPSGVYEADNGVTYSWVCKFDDSDDNIQADQEVENESR